MGRYMGVTFYSSIIAVKTIIERQYFELVSNSHSVICCVSIEGT